MQPITCLNLVADFFLKFSIIDRVDKDRDWATNTSYINEFIHSLISGSIGFDTTTTYTIDYVVQAEERPNIDKCLDCITSSKIP